MTSSDKPSSGPRKRKRIKTSTKVAHTVAERREAKIKRELAAAKRAVIHRTKKLSDIRTIKGITAETLEGGVVEQESLDLLSDLAVKNLEDEDKIIFKPNPGPQTEFLAATEQEVFYGGARGGGKSYAILVDPLRYCNKRHHRAVLIRRTMPELRDLIVKSQFLYPKAYPGAVWREQERVWTFPSGARMEFGYAENMQDAMRYLGQSYTWIGVDELPLFPTPEIWNFLRSSLRSVDPEIPTYMRATGNPGNVGSMWIRDEFINPVPPNTRFYTEVKYHKPNGEEVTTRRSRRFIPAKVWDNPYLTYNDEYVAALASLPESQRKQFLDGDWDVIEGASFSEFNRAVHVCDPYTLPSNWTRFRAADWGFSSPACCLWFAVDYDHNLIVYREYYGKGKNAEEFANIILNMEKGDQVTHGILDASTWARRGDMGPSIAETMIRMGCLWRQSDRSPNSRISGKLEVHRRLAIDPKTSQPRIKIFNNCVNLIRTLPALPRSKTNPEDVDTDGEDHAYDALRYGCMSRPVNSNFSRDIFSTRSTVNPYSKIIDPVLGY